MISRSSSGNRGSCWKKLTSILLSIFITCPLQVFAAPTGGQVVSGTASIIQSGTTTDINQSTNKAIINWQGFSISSNETVNFNQPSVYSMTLNRVIGNEKSIIAGALNATGKVYIVNANGILFTKDASINVGGLVASTLNITNDDFLKGNYVFQGTGQSGEVINMGVIKATGNGTSGGYVALLGDQVKNEGIIIAERGTVSLNGAQKVTLNFNGDSLVNVSLDEGSLTALVENKKAIIADGGKVILTAKAANDLVSSQVNVSGIVQAQTLADLTGGSIEVYAHGGTTTVSGTLDASAPSGGNGGSIETSGKSVKIADTATITTASAKGKTGTWTIDPDGFTIASYGGDITGATLGKQLASTNVTIYSTQGTGTDGGIAVNDTVAWSANTLLTLNATNAITVNGTLSPTGTSGGIVFLAGTDIYINTPLSLASASLNATAGGSIYLAGALSWTGNQTISLTSAYDLKLYGAITGGNGTLNLTSTTGNVEIDGVTTLGATTLNATATAGNVDVNAAVTWTGDSTATLAAANNININAPLTATGTNAGLVMNYGDYASTGATATGTDYSIASYASITLSGSSATLSINGQNYILIHSMDDLAAISPVVYDTIYNIVYDDNGYPLHSIASGYYALVENLNASGTTYDEPVIYSLGGTLAGLGHTISNLTIASTTRGDLALIGTLGSDTNSTATIRDLGLISPSVNAGMNGSLATLVEYNWGLIENAYATNISVVGGGYMGGLVAFNMMSGVIKDSYVGLDTSVDSNATSTVSTPEGMLWAATYTGGFVGTNRGTITGCYSQASVIVMGQGGGFVGSNSKGGTISSSYATGAVTATGGVAGGFAIDNSGTISDSYSTGAVSSLRSDLANFSSNGTGAGGFIVTNGTGGTISNSWSSSTAYADNTGGYTWQDSYAGGFAAYNRGTLNSVSAYGDATSVTGAAGGLVGSNNYKGSIIDSTATGNVSGYYYAGGLVGYNDRGSVSGSSAYGNVSNTATDGAYVGGLIGVLANGTVTESVAYGSVSTSATGDWVYKDGVIGSQWGGSSSNNTHSSDTAAIDAANAQKNANLATAAANAAPVTSVAETTAAAALAATSAAAANASSVISNIQAQAAAAAYAARMEGIAQIAPVANGQLLSVSQSAPTNTDVLRADTKEVSMAEAIRDFSNPSGASGASGSRMSSFNAGIKTITADGVTYIVDDNNAGNDENTRNKKAPAKTGE